jgi:thiol-disulfide isomerase/thioredoxin
VAGLLVLQVRQVARLPSMTPAKPMVGEVAPALGFSSADGSAIEPSEFRGRVVIVSFWAAWCAPCRKELPELASLVDDWNSRADETRRVSFVMVNQGEPPESLSMFIDDPRLKSARFTFDPDGAIANRWKVAALPTTLLIGRDGRVLDAQQGYDQYLRFRFENVLRKELGSASAP